MFSPDLTKVISQTLIMIRKKIIKILNTFIEPKLKKKRLNFLLMSFDKKEL